MEQGEHIRRQQRELRARGYDLGPGGVDGIRGPDTNAAMRAANAARSAFRRPSGGGDASGLIGSIFSLLAFGLACYAIYWFVTVVLPILLMIAAGIFGLCIVFAVLRFCVRRFGLAATLKGTAVAVIVPSLITGYIMNFVGDFEANGDTAGYQRASLRAPRCGGFSEGTNISFAIGNPTVDTIDGRWALVTDDGQTCWMPYRSIRKQHGLFLSLVNLVVPLRSTDDDDRSARTGALQQLDARTTALHRAGNWSGLTQEGVRLRGEEASVLPSTAAHIEEADARLDYANLLTASQRAPDSAREAIYRQAQALSAPADKHEIREMRAAWIAGRCQAIATSVAASTDALEVRIRTIVATASDCHGVRPDALASVASTLAQSVANEQGASLAQQEIWLSSLARAFPEQPGLRTMSEASTAARRAADLALANGTERGEPELQFSARCALANAPDLVPLPESQERRARTANERNVRRAAGALLSLLRDDDRQFRLALMSAPFAAAQGVVPAAVAGSPRQWRIASVVVDSCGKRATLGLLRRASRRDPPQSETLTMCFHVGNSSWLPCVAPTEAAR